MQQSFTVTYSLPSSTVGDDGTSSYGSDKKVLLEQEAWSAYAGYLTKANLARYVGMLIYGEEFFEPLIDCNFDGELITIVHAYPFENTSYSMGTNYGDFDGVAETSNPEVTAMIQFNPSDSGSVSYPISSVKSHTWLGQVYDENNNPTSDPGFSTYKDEITLTKKVYGTLELVYTTFRTSYVLTAEPRVDVEDYETKFDIVVWARYSEGVAWLILSEPPDIDSLLEGSCGRRTAVNVIPPPCKPDNPDPEDKLIEYDYCQLERTTPEDP